MYIMNSYWRKKGEKMCQNDEADNLKETIDIPSSIYIPLTCFMTQQSACHCIVSLQFYFQ